MSKPNGILAEHDTLVNFDASTLTGSYQAINGSGTGKPLVAFKFYNSSTSLVLISYDGTTDHDFVTPGGSFVFDAQSNARGIEGKKGSNVLAEGQVVYAKTTSNTNRLVMAGYA